MRPSARGGVVAVVASVACGSSRPPPAQQQQPPLVLPTGVVRIGAFAAEFFATGARPVVVGDELVVLDRDHVHVAAYGLADGALRWRTQVQDRAFGLQELFARSGRVLVHTGDAMITLDAASGAPAARHAVTPQPDGEGCELWEQRDACAIVCTCRMEPVACDDGRSLGSARDATITHTDYVGVDPPFSDDCIRDRPALIGRAGELVLYEINREVFALDLATGAERWQIAVEPSSTLGMSADRAVFWRESWSGSDAVAVYSSATGALLWSRPAIRDVLAHSFATDTGLVISAVDIVSHVSTAALYDAASGAERWHVTLPPNTRALAVPARLAPFDSVDGGSAAAVAVLDARDGRQLYFARPAWVGGDLDGGVEIYSGQRRISLDASGRPRALPDDGDQVIARDGRTRITSSGGALLAALDGEYHVEARPRWAGGELLLLGLYGPHGLRAAVLLRPAAAAAR